MAQKQTMIIAAIVVVIIAIVAVAVFALPGGDDGGDTKDVSAMADNFAENFTSDFGDFYVESGATSTSASVMTDTGSDRMPHSKFTYTVADDASSEFLALKSSLGSMQGFMGATPVEVIGITGFDGVSVYKMDVRMGTMAVFTLVYFAAYDGNILLDGTDDAFYHNGAIATDDEIKNLMAGISASLDKSCVKDARGMAMAMAHYDGGFGDFYVGSDSTASSAIAMTDTSSDRMPHSIVTYSFSDSASKDFETIAAKIAGMEGFMGGTPTEVTGIAGFDDICVYKMDVRMGTMAVFTMVYFVAYDGDVLIDGSEDALYFSGSLATDEDIQGVFKAIVASVS